jgi:hypothetical protein
MGKGASKPPSLRPLDWSTMPPLRFVTTKEKCHG